MAFLELKDIGKIYSTEGAVAVGIRGVNLEFNLGEFVAITGKSGCGKTTLLNVMSGMDTYEEGELFVEGSGTQHFGQKEWEEYRQKYIAFIFQDYNIIDSFTVLENVELALTDISDPKERKEKAMELIRRVGLESHIKNKGSQLSGGQKQRTVIARALAKNSPIILADEPTGNLDSVSSKEIIALLGEISKEKLVVVVTHNFDDVEQFATRHIRIFDGSVQSDDTLRPYTPCAETKARNAILTRKQIWRDSAALGLTKYKARPKLSVFLTLIMTIACIIVCVVTSLCSMPFQVIEENSYALSRMKGRALVTRADGAQMTQEEKTKLASDFNAKVVENDFLMDEVFAIGYDYSHNTYPRRLSDFNVKVASGRMPTGAGEAVVSLPIGYKSDIEKEFKSMGFLELANNEFASYPIKIVGANYYLDNSKQSFLFLQDDDFTKLAHIFKLANLENIELIPGVRITMIINKSLVGNNMKLTYDQFDGAAIKDMDLQLGTIITYNISGQNFDFVLSEIAPSETSKNGRRSFYEISEEMAKKITDQSSRQVSLIFESDKAASKQVAALESKGYITIVSTTKIKDSTEIMNYVMAIVMSMVWLVAVAFLVFFVTLTTTKAIRSNKEDIAIFRSMGISHKVIKKSMFFHLLPVTLVSLVIMGIFAVVFFLTSLGKYFSALYWYHYVVIILAMFVATIAIAAKFNKKLMKQSVRKNLRRDDK
ncbi:MAG: ATP-binding cassette domain-containing protein [Clostridia bacterium]